MKSKIAIGAAVANHSEAMETRDHFKNGASPKSQTSRGNIEKNGRKTLLIFLLMIGLYQLGYSQTAIPNSFLDIKLGTKLSDFLSKNSDAVKEERYLGYEIYSNIKISGMEIYRVERVTSSGDRVGINNYFYNNNLSVIRVYYLSGQSLSGFLDALESKYGAYTSYGQNQGIVSVYWTKTTCILNFLYNTNTRSTYLFFADRATQQKLEAEKIKSDVKKIE